MNSTNVSGSGATTTELSVSGMDAMGMLQFQMYSMYVCGGGIGLEVSDGTNAYTILPPACGYYSLESMLYTEGQYLSYAYEDPWGRTRSATTNPAILNVINNDVIGVIVEPATPLTVTYFKAGVFTLKTSSDLAEACSSLGSATFTSQSKSAGSTWTDPSPINSRVYCMYEDTPI